MEKRWKDVMEQGTIEGTPLFDGDVVYAAGGGKAHRW
jgi:hypothetical protein